MPDKGILIHSAQMLYGYTLHGVFQSAFEVVSEAILWGIPSCVPESAGWLCKAPGYIRNLFLGFSWLPGMGPISVKEGFEPHQK